MAEMGNACSRMSFTRPAKLPHSLMMASCSSRQSGWLGMMPRSRQMSAMTAPIGWRRTSGGDLLRGGQVYDAGVGFVRGGRGGWPGCARPPWRRSASGRRVQAMGDAEEPRLERVGAVQAAGDACEDQRDIGGAEAAADGGGVGEGAAADRGGEFAAVVDELADEAEQVGRAAGLGGWIRGVGRGGHDVRSSNDHYASGEGRDDDGVGRGRLCSRLGG